MFRLPEWLCDLLMHHLFDLLMSSIYVAPTGDSQFLYPRGYLCCGWSETEVLYVLQKKVGHHWAQRLLWACSHRPAMPVPPLPVEGKENSDYSN